MPSTLQGPEDEVLTVLSTGAGAAESRQTRTKSSTGMVVASYAISLFVFEANLGMQGLTCHTLTHLHIQCSVTSA